MILTTQYSSSLLLASCNRAFKSAGVWGAATLLAPPNLVATAAVLDPLTNAYTCANPHRLITSSRVKLVGAAVIYRVVVLTPTTFKLTDLSLTLISPSLLPSAVAWTEEILNQTDPLAVLLNKEVTHPGYLTRTAITNLGGATLVSGVATKAPKLVQFSNTLLGSDPISFQHILYIEEGLVTLGSVPSTSNFILTTLTTIEALSFTSLPFGSLLTLSTFN